jgi:hypothetical protein
MQKERMSRYQVEDGESLRRTRAELQVKVRECELLARDCDAGREASRREADGLRQVIANLTASFDEVKLESLKLHQETAQMREQAESDKRLAFKDLERKLQEEFSRSER